MAVTWQLLARSVCLLYSPHVAWHTTMGRDRNLNTSPILFPILVSGESLWHKTLYVTLVSRMKINWSFQWASCFPWLKALTIRTEKPYSKSPLPQGKENLRPETERTEKTVLQFSSVPPRPAMCWQLSWIEVRVESASVPDWGTRGLITAGRGILRWYWQTRCLRYCRAEGLIQSIISVVMYSGFLFESLHMLWVHPESFAIAFAISIVTTVELKKSLLLRWNEYKFPEITNPSLIFCAMCFNEMSKLGSTLGCIHNWRHCNFDYTSYVSSDIHFVAL